MTNGGTYIGKQIGNYRIVTEIASSYFSHVFRGEHVFLHERIVAIKLLHAYLDSPQESDRFLQEAQFLAKLRHRYIMSIVDVGTFENLPYLVVEYAQNGSLRDRLRRHPSPRPLPLDEALTILLQVGQALQYAHEMNVVHRDLKPENILFNSRNEALLADFNIATVLETAKTKSIDIIGSPLYMAPEQFEGIISKRSDLYALGCIAYELLQDARPSTPPALSRWALNIRTRIRTHPLISIHTCPGKSSRPSSKHWRKNGLIDTSVSPFSSLPCNALLFKSPQSNRKPNALYRAASSAVKNRWQHMSMPFSTLTAPSSMQKEVTCSTTSSEMRKPWLLMSKPSGSIPGSRMHIMARQIRSGVSTAMMMLLLPMTRPFHWTRVQTSTIEIKASC